MNVFVIAIMNSFLEDVEINSEVLIEGAQFLLPDSLLATCSFELRQIPMDESYSFKNRMLIVVVACLFQIRNKETGGCLDSMGRKQGEKVGMVSCHGLGGNQVGTNKDHKVFGSVHYSWAEAH